MKKKNKRKAPDFKKPFIVLTRGKIAGWSILIFFLCAWMFVLGVLVGRGTAPVEFDIAALEKKLTAPQAADSAKQEKEASPERSATVKDKTKLDFYEALKENKEDTKVPILKEPKAAESKTEEPSNKGAAAVKTPQKSDPPESRPKKAASREQVASVAKTKAAGPAYTIQAAAFKDPKDADRLIQKLKKRGYPAYRAIGKVAGKGIWFRVRIGKYGSKSKARPVLDKLKKDGYKPILVMQ